MATAKSNLQIVIDVIQGKGSGEISAVEQGLNNLAQKVKDYEQKLQAATPENVKFANSFIEIQQSVKDGTLSIDDARVEIDKLQREMEDAGASTEKFGDEAQKSGMKWTELKSQIDLAVGVLREVGQAMQAVWEMAKKGAELELTEQRFNRLAASIGTTGDALMKDLKPAIGGLLSDAETMGLATELMSLGLVKTGDQATRLARLVAELDMPMNQLVQALSNMTTMRFDSLNMSVDGFQERLEAMPEGLSEAEAFLMAFLEQGEEQLDKLGGAADTAAGEFRKAEAEWKNFTDNVAKGTTTAILPVISHFNDFYDAIDVLSVALDDNIITYDEYIMLLSQIEMGTIDAGDVVDDYSDKIVTHERYVDGLNERYTEYLKLLGKIPGDTDDASDATEDLSVDIKKVGLEAQYAEEAHKKYIKSLAEGKEITKEAAENQAALDAALRASADAASAALDGMQKYVGIFEDTDPQEQSAAITDAVTESLVDQAEAAAAAGLYYQPYLDALEELDPDLAAALAQSLLLSDSISILNQLLADGKITPEEYAAKVVDLNKALEEGKDPTTALTDLLGDLEGVVKENIIQTDNFKISLDELVLGSPYEIVVHTTYTESGTQPSTGDDGSTIDTPDYWNPDAGNTGVTEQFGTSGEWKTVPGGYPGDTFPVWMTSGEKYMVATQGEQLPGGRPIIQNITMQVYNPETAAMSAAYINSMLLAETRANL